MDALLGSVPLDTPVRALADPAPNAVIDWAAIAQRAIHSKSVPRSAGTSQILHAMVLLAVYDAVVAIEGGYQPYAAHIESTPSADVRVAVATAAYLTARARVASSQVLFLDQRYANYLSDLPDGPGKAAAIRVGEAAAAAILAARAGDGFSAGAPQLADAQLGQIKPFTFTDSSAILTEGSDSMTSSACADDIMETRDNDRAKSGLRSADQIDIAYFWSENPYVHWNGNLIHLAIGRGLDLRDTARLFAMVHTTAADAIIAGFDAKSSDPEHPSAHGSWSTAVVDSIAAFFGTNRVTWKWTYPRPNVTDGEQIGRRVADWSGPSRRRRAPV